MRWLVIAALPILSGGAGCGAEPRDDRYQSDGGQRTAGRGEEVAATSDAATLHGLPPHLEITYLANAGVRIASGQDTVLIDALFDLNVPPGVPPRLHQHLPPDLLARLERGAPPFGCPDLALATHGHDDHLTEGSVLRFLEHCAEAALVLPADLPEAGSLVARGALSVRVTPVRADPRTSVQLTAGGLALHALGMLHGSRTGQEPSHLAYLVTVGSYRVLHLGDATPSAENLAAFDGLADAGVDVAVTPWWFVTDEEGRAWLRDRGRPRLVTVVHLNAGNRSRLADPLADAAADFESFTVFTTALEADTLR